MPWTTNVRLVDQVAGQDERPKKSKSSPALDGASGVLLMVHLGDTSDQIWYATLDSHAGQWGRDAAIGALRAEAYPAVAGGLMLFPENRQGHLWQARFTPTVGWAFDTDNADVKFEGTENLLHANVRPCLAYSPKGLHLVFKSPTSTRISHAFLPHRALRWQSVGNLGDQERGTYLTKTRPAAAVEGDTLHVLHLGEDSNRIYHARGALSFDNRDRISGVSWTESRIDGQYSKAAPAAAIFDGQLHMVHLGDSSSDLWHSIYFPDLEGWLQRKIPDQSSKAPPAMAAFDARLHLVHLGQTSNQIWWSKWPAP
jgi:hypothetical protein